MPNEIWDPRRIHLRGRKASMSLQRIKDMQPGDVIQVTHDDLHCTVGIPHTKPACSLGVALYYLNKRGRQYEYYHTANKVATVRRVN